MSLAEALSLAASITSIVLAIVAIWLSVLFYRMSEGSSTRIKDSADKVAVGVASVQLIVDRFYRDTFSVMRETVADVRRHAWPEATATIDAEAESRAQLKIEALQHRLHDDVSRLVSNQAATDARLTDVSSSLQGLLSRAVEESRKIEAEAREQTIRDRVINSVKTLVTTGSDITLAGLLDHLRDSLSETDVVVEVGKLRDDGVLTWSGPRDRLRWSDRLTLASASAA